MAEINSQTYDTVYGYFSSEDQAEAAVRALHAAGFRRSDISIAGNPESGQWSRETTRDAKVDRQALAGVENQSHPAYHEGHKVGEKIGGFWQRIKNLFEGDAAEPYRDEAQRGHLATHEITDTYDYDPRQFHLSWAVNSPTDDRLRYFTDRWSQSGQGVLIAVSAPGRRAEAESILKANGADLGTNTAGTTAGRSTMAGTAAGSTVYASASNSANEYYSNTADRSTAGEFGSEERFASSAQQREQERTQESNTPRRIQLYGEVLRVHRDRIQRGEVRVRKEIVTENQTVQVPVTREELVVERAPVTGEQPAPGARIGEQSEVRIPLSEDSVSVEREPVVREQVEVGKREVTNLEQREEPVRREELVVDDEKRFPKAS